MKKYTIMNGNLRVYKDKQKTLFVSNYITVFFIIIITIPLMPLLSEIINDIPFWIDKIFIF